MNFTTYFFIMEASLKIVTQGLYKHKNSYLRDGWNIVDFSVVMFSILEMILLQYADSLPSLKMLRALRVIRPLRSVKRVPSMRRLVSIMLRSLPELGNTLVFMMFFFTVFGIIGIQTFHGNIYQRCRLTEKPVENRWEIDTSQSHFICSNGSNELTKCKEGTFCGSPLEYSNLDPLQDDPWEDEMISYNTMNFNNIFVGVVMIFEALTLEGWSQQMSFFIDSGQAQLSIIFYLLLVAFGSYFILNLILAVIMGSFTKFEGEEIQNKIMLAENKEIRTIEKGKIEEDHEQEKKNRNKLMVHRRKPARKIPEPEQNIKKKESQISFNQSSANFTSPQKDFELKSSPILIGKPPLAATRPSCANIQISNLDFKVENPFQKQKTNLEQRGDFKSLIEPDSGTKIQKSSFCVISEEQKEEEIELAPIEMNQQVLTPETNFRMTTQQTQHLFNQQRELEISNEEEYEQQYNTRNWASIRESKSQFDIDFYRKSHDEISGFENYEGGSSNLDVVSERLDSVDSDHHHIKHKSITSHTQMGLQNMVTDSPINKSEKNSDEQKKEFKVRCSKIIKNTGKKYALTELYKFFNAICQSNSFVIVILLTIFLNTISLSLDRYPIDPDEIKMLEHINKICTWIFVGEMVIKIIGLGIVTYSMDSMNQFDAIVVIISIVEMVLSSEEKQNVEDQDDQQQYITIFRGFRLLRAFRLVRQWKSFHKMIVKIGHTIKDIFMFFVLLLIIVSVFTLLGVEIFNNDLRMNENDQICLQEDTDPSCLSPRLNFDNFQNGFVTVFVCFIGEDWQLVMHQYVRSHKSHLLPYLYFISLMVIGNLFIMNLFLAILLKNFEDKSQVSIEEEKEDEQQQSSVMVMLNSLKKKLSTKNAQKNQLIDINHAHNVIDQTDADKMKQQVGNVLIKGTLQKKVEGEIKSNLKQIFKKRSTLQGSVKLIDENKGIDLYGRSLYIFGDKNPFRRIISRIVTHNFFEMFIFAMVLLSALIMIFEDPLSDPNSLIFTMIDYINQVITGIFIFELVLKVIVFGLYFNGSKSYLKNGWNILDLIIVSFSIASIIIEQLNEESDYAKNLQLLKMLRVLRSLRMISKSEGLKLSVLSLIYSAPSILNVTVVSMLFLLLLAIFFLNTLKGKFYHCIYPQNLEEFLEKSKVKTRMDCVNYGGYWVNQKINFDNIASSLLALFTMSTTEGWVYFMQNATDAVGIGLEPQRGQNIFYQYIFILFMIFGSLFITNLFIEAVITTFDREKKKIDRNFKLTQFQQEWIEMQLKCYELAPKTTSITKIQTSNKFRQYCIKIVEYKYFEVIIMSFILLNAFVLTFVWIDIDPQITYYTEQLQVIFTFIFGIECVLKLVAFEKFYFYNSWNIFDFSIVLGGLIGQLILSQFSVNISVIRILRTCRVLRLLKKAKRLYIIFTSFLNTIPAFINVGSLILVLIYIFSIIGNRLFATVKQNEMLNRHFNFQSFTSSFLTLIVMMTGEGWYELMSDLQRQKDHTFECMENPSYDDYKANNYQTLGCGINNSTWFFILYIFFVSLILVNLFIAVTLQGFKDVQTTNSCRVTDMDLNKFQEVWSDLDPEGTGYIHISEAASLLRLLIEQKCELLPSNAKDIVFDADLLGELIEHLQLKLYKKFQYYNFHDIMISLAQLHASHLGNREQELQEILTEYLEVNKEEAEDLDAVIQKIDKIMEEDNVKMCKQLSKALVKFKNNVLPYIDIFQGNSYTSSMIPVVVRIQKIFRQKRKLKAALEYNEERKQIQLKRKNVLTNKTFDEVNNEKRDSNANLIELLKRKHRQSSKHCLDRMITGESVSQDTEQDGWAGIMKSLKKKQSKKTNEYDSSGLKRISVTNSRQTFGTDGGQSIQIIKLKNFQTVEPEDVKKALIMYYTSKGELQVSDQPPEINLFTSEEIKRNSVSSSSEKDDSLSEEEEESPISHMSIIEHQAVPETSQSVLLSPIESVPSQINSVRSKRQHRRGQNHGQPQQTQLKISQVNTPNLQHSNH